MENEIDKNLFCSGDFYRDGYCENHDDDCGGLGCCKLCHRKWPTVSQFKEEYERKLKVGCAVYQLLPVRGFNDDVWEIGTWDGQELPGAISIVTCTPWGKPPANWRPE